MADGRRKKMPKRDLLYGLEQRRAKVLREVAYHEKETGNTAGYERGLAYGLDVAIRAVKQEIPDDSEEPPRA